MIVPVLCPGRVHTCSAPPSKISTPGPTHPLQVYLLDLEKRIPHADMPAPERAIYWDDALVSGP